jgi:hypothetical protein
MIFLYKHSKNYYHNACGMEHFEKKVNFNGGPRLIHKLDGRLLSIKIMEVITRDMGVSFGQTIPCWKGNSMRKMMEYVSRGKLAIILLEIKKSVNYVFMV